MSRSGYVDYLEDWSMICYRGAVASAIRGKRGQAFLREMLAALDALPEPRLAAHSFTRTGVCAIGSVALRRGLDVSEFEDYGDDHGLGNEVAPKFGIAPALAAEIMFVNDEASVRPETPEERFARVRKWVKSQIATDSPTPPAEGVGKT